MDSATIAQQVQERGFFVSPPVLTEDDLARARDGLDRGVELMKQWMPPNSEHKLDPNDANVRVVNLPVIDPIFIDLLRRRDALAAVEAVLGPHFLVSNFTANIALPGSGSMKLHSDQSLVVPPPWLHPWAMNIIWCLDDVRAANGATLYLPGSHRYRSFEDVPTDAMDRMAAFEAPAGSFIVMEGRVWHTSGKNVTAGECRRLLFAYYSSDFVRQQINWALALPSEVASGMDPATRALFGLSGMGNTRIGAQMTNLAAPA